MSHEIEKTHRRPLLHASSGLAILGLDWLLFSGNFLTAGAATLPVSILGFLLGGTAVAICQRNSGNDSLPASLAKGLAAGIAVGVPFPIAGTALGGFILTASGLNLLRGNAQDETGSGEK